MERPMFSMVYAAILATAPKTSHFQRFRKAREKSGRKRFLLIPFSSRSQKTPTTKRIRVIMEGAKKGRIILTLVPPRLNISATSSRYT